MVDGGYTHIAYAFGIMNDDGRLDFADRWGAIDMGVTAQLRDLKEDLGIKVGISIGGWSHRAQIEEICQSDDRLQEFIESTSQLVQEQHYDFVDVDWEFEEESITEKAGDTLHRFIEGLRDALPSSVIITMPIQCNPRITKHLNLGKLVPMVSMFTVMGYNLSGPWCESAEHVSSLSEIRHFIDGDDSIPREKICIGISGCGGMFTECTAMGSNYNGYEDKSAKEVDWSQWSHQWDDEASSSYYISDTTLLSIESKMSIACKTEYIRRLGLAGLAVWDIEAFSHLPDQSPD